MGWKRTLSTLSPKRRLMTQQRKRNTPSPSRSTSAATRFTKRARPTRSMPNSGRWSEVRSWRRCSDSIPILLTVHIHERLRTRSPDDESHKEDLHAPPWQGAATGRSTGRKLGIRTRVGLMEGTRHRVHLSVSEILGQLVQKVGDIAETAGLGRSR